MTVLQVHGWREREIRRHGIHWVLNMAEAVETRERALAAERLGFAIVAAESIFDEQGRARAHQLLQSISKGLGLNRAAEDGEESVDATDADYWTNPEAQPDWDALQRSGMYQRG